MIKAIVKAHRWRRQIESAQYRSASELAAHERLGDSYVSRMLCLTLLAPDITQAILEGQEPKSLKLTTLLRGIPLAWDEQRQQFAFCKATVASDERCRSDCGGTAPIS